MTLSLLATQASPAAVSPATATADEAGEPTQDFAAVLQQEGQQNTAANAGAVSQDCVGDSCELPVDTTETDTSLVAVLLGTLPAATDAVADDDEIAAEPTADDTRSGDDVAVTPLTAALLALIPAESNPPDSARGLAEPVITESQLLPPGGKALPAWSMLLQPAFAGKTDISVANQAAASAANLPAGLGSTSLGVDGTALTGSFDNKAFQTLLRSDPLLTGLAGTTRNLIDNATGAFSDAAVSTLADTALLGASQNATAASTTTAAELVPGLPVRSPAFGTLLANQVLWQAKVGNNEAAIRLDPPELGPIDVRISQVDNETHLHFTVGHGLTRDQLEQAVPRLRELFSQGGLSLGQVLVEQGSRDTASQRDGGNGNSGANARGNAGTETAPVSVRLLNGLIDDYA